MSKEKKLLEIIRNIVEDESEFYMKAADQLSITEYRSLKRALFGINCLNCINEGCPIPSYEKTGDNGSKCIGWDNKELVGRSKVLKENLVFKLR
ncbi:MAG: hypothetical protein PHT75_05070 [Bacilli bacterium]|nr:hypothetical protein [Bacilli bacterium]